MHVTARISREKCRLLGGIWSLGKATQEFNIPAERLSTDFFSSVGTLVHVYMCIICDMYNILRYILYDVVYLDLYLYHIKIIRCIRNRSKKKPISFTMD